VRGQRQPELVRRLVDGRGDVLRHLRPDLDVGVPASARSGPAGDSGPLHGAVHRRATAKSGARSWEPTFDPATRYDGASQTVAGLPMPNSRLLTVDGWWHTYARHLAVRRTRR
jgi:hypothetical protein